MSQLNQLQQTASQLLAAMLSNPHIYPKVSDEGGNGAMEEQLIILAIEMAESLNQHIEDSHGQAAAQLKQKN